MQNSSFVLASRFCNIARLCGLFARNRYSFLLMIHGGPGLANYDPDVLPLTGLALF